MNRWQTFVRSISFFTVSLALMLFFLAPVASARVMSPLEMSAIERVFNAEVKDGTFTVDVTFPVDNRLRVGAAVISLPENETGTIDSIIITGPNGDRELGCEGLKVENGTDLIQSCGGPAYLEIGETRYQAQGSNFQPNPDVNLEVKLAAEISNKL
jgi:hypothetical protein